ncbi:MAG: hypothetical protein M0003_04495 [Acidithiobacillus sp.]|nr:hypothetical protein [Acidithiobacillus sp.]
MQKTILAVAISSALLTGVWANSAWALVEYSSAKDVAVGDGSSAIGQNDVGINGSANGLGNTNINGYLPYTSSTLDNQGTAASGSSSGSGSTLSNNPATAVGDGSYVYYNGSDHYEPGTAVGSYSAANGNATVVGSGTQAGLAGLSDSIPVSQDDTAIAGRIDSGSDNTAIGGGTVTTGNGNIAEGEYARSSGNGSVAIGSDATAGKTALALALDPSTAVGSGATATGQNSEAYGYDASATGNESQALGTKSQASLADSVALGSDSTANTAQTGQGDTETIRGQSYSLAGGSPSGEVSVGSASGGITRLITNVAAGQISSVSTQAVNGSELFATNQAINNLQVTQSSQGVLHYTTSSGAASSTPTDTASAGTSATGPVTISNVANGTIAAGSTTAANGNDVYEAEQGAQADANRAQYNAEGYAGQVAAVDSGQALQAANAHSNNLFTLTCHHTGNGSGDIVCGRGTTVSGKNAMAEGTGSHASGQDATAYGAGSIANGQAATAIGPNAVANGYSTTALGDHAQALAPNSTALGENAVARGDNSVALGQGSVANRANSVSVGNAATGLDRQITNVAAATEPHDAVNLQQFDAGLHGLKTYANAEADKVGSVDASLGEAAAQAAAGHGVNTVASGVADYNGQASFAFSYQHRFNHHWTGGITVGSDGGAANTVVAAGAGYSWR